MKEKVYLQDYKSFVTIDDTYYGGDQTWLFNEKHISKFWANRACGLVAVSNTLSYLSRSEYPPHTRQSFTNYAMKLYPFIKPKVYGIPTVSSMIKSLKKYASSKNWILTPIALIKPTNITTVVTYIKNALDQDYPIMMVTLNTKTRGLKYHWVTITGYYKNSLGENFILTSNWGKQEIYSLDQWVGERSFYKGLLWFKLKGQQNDCLR